MDVVKRIREVRKLAGQARGTGGKIALVPTMGALHAGHFSLIDAARSECDFLVVSIFVNPTQFAPHEDLSSYPRTEGDDLAACRARGADVVFIPPCEEMYPFGKPKTEITVPQLAGTLCGASRPGHFAGVCIVVAKLLNIVAPDRAYFGEKDYQQAAIIRRMVKDMNLPVEIVTCPIVREPDGLAMSSRNGYLSDEQRREAPALYGSLQLAAEMIRSAHPPVEDVIGAVRRYLSENAPLGEIDYVQVVDPDTLSDVRAIDGKVLVAVAVKFERARLIDNMLVDAGCDDA